LKICQDGKYVVNDQTIDISQDLKLCVERTAIVSSTRKVKETETSPHVTRFGIFNATSFRIAEDLQGKAKLGILNFASAHKPGGGMLNGRNAQEEFICRSSGLYPCLQKCGEFYNQTDDAKFPNMNSNNIIVSVDVPIFRDDDGSLLERPFNATFLTCAAVDFRRPRG